MRTRVVLVAVLAAACARERTPPDIPRVEAVFDVPREYRVLGTLPCAESAALVYLVVSEGDLYGFRPDTLAFHHVGKLRCPATPGATPNSMAVDRSGTAWINYSDGTLHRASTRDARCAATDFQPRWDAFRTPGMAFVSSGPELRDETLFLWGGRDPPRGALGRGLAYLDRATMDLVPVGREDRREPRAELTGTGDGRLYGFFTTSPATLGEIDPASGDKRGLRPLPGVTGVQSWAFSFWGGDFYLYWARYGGETSHVTRVSGRDGAVEELLHDVGFRIVGAGVSTCAPLGPAR